MNRLREGPTNRGKPSRRSAARERRRSRGRPGPPVDRGGGHQDLLAPVAATVLRPRIKRRAESARFPTPARNKSGRRHVARVVEFESNGFSTASARRTPTLNAGLYDLYSTIFTNSTIYNTILRSSRPVRATFKRRTAGTENGHHEIENFLDTHDRFSVGLGGGRAATPLDTRPRLPGQSSREERDRQQRLLPALPQHGNRMLPDRL